MVAAHLGSSRLTKPNLSEESRRDGPSRRSAPTPFPQIINVPPSARDSSFGHTRRVETVPVELHSALAVILHVTGQGRDGHTPLRRSESQYDTI